jgi:hypothetical protein
MGNTTSAVPNPGSPEAVMRGCTCPQIDNHYGKGEPRKDGPTFWIAGNCQMHATAGKAP